MPKSNRKSEASTIKRRIAGRIKTIQSELWQSMLDLDPHMSKQQREDMKQHVGEWSAVTKALLGNYASSVLN